MKIVILIILLLGYRPIRSQNIKIRPNSTVAKLVGKFMGSTKFATTFHRTVYLTCSKDKFFADTSWVRHEFTHIQQYKKYGTLEFLKRYFFYFLIKGYYKNPFEVEAFNNE